MSVHVSVIIPTYNRARFIGPTLESILGQDYAPSEIIVVNDGSTDATASVVGAYAPAVSLINIENVGPTGARSAGVTTAKYNWLAFCDHDDLWHRDHLSRLVELADKHDVSFAFSNFTHVTNGRRAERSHFEVDPGGFWIRPGRPVGNESYVADQPLFPRVLSFQAIFPSCTLVNRDFFERVGGLNPAFGRNPSEDLEFTLRCVVHKPVGIVVRPTVDVSRHDQNMSGDWIRSLAGSIAILKYAQANHGLQAVYKTAVEREIVSRSMLAVDCCFTQRRFGEIGMFAENLSGTVIPRKTAVKIGVSKQPKVLAFLLSSLFAAGANTLGLSRSLRGSRS
jgi:glycosyltransferase involved in cell wall biosynthesis